MLNSKCSVELQKAYLIDKNTNKMIADVTLASIDRDETLPAGTNKEGEK